MDQIEISEKIKAIAESTGLSAEELQELLNGGEAIPEQLMEVFGSIGDTLSEKCAED